MSGKIKSNAYSPRLVQPNFLDIVSDSRSEVLTVDWDLIGLAQHCGIDL